MTVDPKRIDELKTLFPGTEAAEFLDQLRKEMSEQLDKLGVALQHNEGDAAAEAAHRILNTARMIAAPGLIEAAINLQASATQDAAEILRRRWEAVSAELSNHLR